MGFIPWPSFVGKPHPRFEALENPWDPVFRCLHQERIGYASFLSLGRGLLETRPLRDNVGFVFRKSDPAI
jgi:hypothetical protein